MSESIEGGCHCGNIRLRVAWPEPGERIPARACGCTFCHKHGGLWTSNPAASLEIRIADRERLGLYEFGHGTAHFHVCTRCGVTPVVVSRIDGRDYAVVSVNALEGLDPDRLDRAPADFEGELSGARLERRKRGWIPDVRFV